MTLSDLYRKVKGICACLNSADVPLKFNGDDFNVDFEIRSKDAIVSHVEVKQDLALTWEDVRAICDIDMTLYPRDIELYSKEYYEKVLQEFNKQRRK